MIDRNHPAVEAAVLEYLNAPPGTHVHNAMAAALTEALRILTDPSFDAHNLRNTPAGKQLLAEGWEAACHKVIHMAWADSSDAEYLADKGNPYRTEAPGDAPEG